MKRLWTVDLLENRQPNVSLFVQRNVTFVNFRQSLSLSLSQYIRVCVLRIGIYRRLCGVRYWRPYVSIAIFNTGIKNDGEKKTRTVIPRVEPARTHQPTTMATCSRGTLINFDVPRRATHNTYVNRTSYIYTTFPGRQGPLRTTRVYFIFVYMRTHDV